MGKPKLLRRAANERTEHPLDPRPNLTHHQLHRTHRRLVRGGADLERKAHVDRISRTDLTDQLLGHGLDIADQQIVVDLFEWGFVRERLVIFKLSWISTPNRSNS